MCNCYMMNKYSAVIVSWLVIKCCAMYYYCAEDIGEYYETWNAVLGYTGELRHEHITNKGMKFFHLLPLIPTFMWRSMYDDILLHVARSYTNCRLSLFFYIIPHSVQPSSL